MGQEDPLEAEMAIHSSIFTWRIPWTEEPGGLRFIGLHRVGTQLKRLSMHACFKTIILMAKILGQIFTTGSHWWVLTRE